MSEPTCIARFELIRLLGEGGMGELHLARDPAIDRLVAIKLLKDGLDSAELRERFTREARSAGRLHHPNIVTVFDVGDHQGRPFIAMEYVRGETLREMIRQGAPIPLTRKLEIIEGVCQGLAYAHKSGIVHRDIKPANLMVDADGVVKILDFGIARVDQSEFTRHGMIIGSLNYMSPEQMSGARIDHRTDVFALGAVLYELLSYRQAFPGGISDGVLHRVLSQEPVPLTTLVPRLDPEIVGCVARALRKNPDERYQDLTALRKDLARVRERLEAVGSEATVQLAALDTASVERPGRRTAERELLKQQRTQKIEELLATAERAFKGGAQEEARAACVQLLMIDPDHPTALDLLERIESAEANERRQTELLARAREALEGGSLTLASQLADEADALVPGGADVARLREAVDAARRQRDEIRERERRLRSALERARTSLESGALQGALRTVDEALAIEADHAEAAALKSQILAAMEKRQRREHDRRAQATVEAAKRAFAAGDHDFALERLQAFTPPHDAVSDALRELQAEAERIGRRTAALGKLADAREALQSQRFADAFRAISEGRALDGSAPGLDELQRDAEARQAAVREAERRRRDAAEKVQAASALLRANDAEGAQRVVSEALRIDPEHGAALTLKHQIEALFARRQAEACMRAARAALEAADYDDAFVELDRAHAADPDVPGLADLRRQTEARQAEANQRAERRRQVEEAMQTAERHMTAGDLQRAMDAVQSARRLDAHHDGARTLEQAVQQALDERAAEERRETEARERERRIAQAVKNAEQAKSHEKALGILRHALSIDPHHERLQQRIAERERALADERAERERQRLERERAAQARDVENLVLAAREALDDGRLADAREQAARALELAPEHDAARQLFAAAVAPIETVDEPPTVRLDSAAAWAAQPAPDAEVVPTPPMPPPPAPEPEVAPRSGWRSQPASVALDGDGRPAGRAPDQIVVSAPAARSTSGWLGTLSERIPQRLRTLSDGLTQRLRTWPAGTPRWRRASWYGSAAAGVGLIVASVYWLAGGTAREDMSSASPPAHVVTEPAEPVPPAPEPAESTATTETSTDTPAGGAAADDGIAPPPAAAEPPTISEEATRLAAIHKTAATQMKRGDTSAALNTIVKGLAMSPDDRDLQQALDTILTQAQSRMTSARTRAVDAGAQERAKDTFASAQGLQNQAAAQRKQERKDAAARSLLGAADLFEKAATEARHASASAAAAETESRPAPAATNVSPPTPPPAAPADPSTSKPAAPSPSAAAPAFSREREEGFIKQTLTRWSSAYARLNVDAVKQVHELDAKEEAVLRKSFDDATSYLVDVQVEKIDVAADGRRAIVTARVHRRYDPKVGRARNDRHQQTFTLEKHGDAWRIVGVK